MQSRRRRTKQVSQPRRSITISGLVEGWSPHFLCSKRFSSQIVARLPCASSAPVTRWEAYPIGAPAASESYLNIPKILDVAARSGAEAVHPGYGFLSENAKFARACADAGLKFIGPTATAMDAMGSKTRARQAMERAGVPCVPGTSHGLESFEQAEQVAARVGYPVMLKAAAGGGMLRVESRAI